MSESMPRRNMASLYVFDAAGAEHVPTTEVELADYVTARISHHQIFDHVISPAPLGLGNAAWTADQHFDVRNHISWHELSGSGSWTDLCRDFVRLAETPLPHGRPPWHISAMRVAHGDSSIPTGAIGVILRVEHAAMDGASLVAFARTLFPDTSAAAVQVPVEAQTLTAARPSVAGAVRELPARAATAARHARSAVSAITKPKTSPANKVTTALPPEEMAATEFTERVFDATTVSLEDCQKIRQLVPGSTINDVALSVVAGALRRYLQTYAEVPDKPLLCAITVALQKHGHQRAAGSTEHVGNDITGALLPIGTHIADPRERLRQIHQTSSTTKQRLQLGPQVHIENIIRAIPPGILAALARRIPAKQPIHATSVVNVPRGRNPMYFGDARAIRTHGLPLLNPRAPVAHHVTSLEDRLGIAFVADRSSLANPEAYRVALIDSFNEHLSASAT
ncbi:DUF1298 domain-containing protein [Hoyosella rhizosphaerae]|nr:wax ester/triacylglycerol synthase domain-containing protein [Hoyosella rhizosphaerae]MBN4926764.1 DUF1298 domain-containing protein [Hoyosella rhizosphaerae]